MGSNSDDIRIPSSGKHAPTLREAFAAANKRADEAAQAAPAIAAAADAETQRIADLPHATVDHAARRDLLRVPVPGGDGHVGAQDARRDEGRGKRSK